MGDEPSETYLNYAGGFYRNKLYKRRGNEVKPGDLLQDIIDYFADDLEWGYTSRTYDTAQEVLYGLIFIDCIKKTEGYNYRIMLNKDSGIEQTV